MFNPGEQGPGFTVLRYKIVQFDAKIMLTSLAFGVDIEWDENFALSRRHPRKILEIYMQNSTFSCILSAYDHPKISQNIWIILSNDTQTLRPSRSVRELCTPPIAGDRNSEPLPKNSLPLQPL